ncbi:uncharacterized protein LOC108113075 [Drosophila eugracilis]|uniref:uncharacterized protein LOC108113075 n=1 Tax=Drosophila eugracilis TaxID=29029 RepID=UPI0007E83AFA|nr:uncharacterized protein LOC108113075 [Drosophila eugracilis]
MPLDKLSLELHELKILDCPIEGIKLNGSNSTLGSSIPLADSGVKKQSMKQKLVLRKPRNLIYGRSRADGLDWVKNIEEEKESNWVKIKDRKTDSGNAYDIKSLMREFENISGFGKPHDMKEKDSLFPPRVLGSKTAYDFKSLICECEKLEEGCLYERSKAQFQNHDEDNVEELASYFENLANIPKKLSLMAEMMYS